MFGDLDAAGRNDEGDGGRDIEAFGAAAAGAAGIEDRFPVDVDLLTVEIEHAGRPGSAWPVPRITRAAPVISATVSPFMRRAVIKAPTWAGVASPPMIWFMTSIISASERSCRSTTLAIASLDHHRLLPIPIHVSIEKIPQQLLAFDGQDRLGMELHPPDRQFRDAPAP